MKRLLFCLLALFILLSALPRPPTIAAGTVRIGNIRAELMTEDTPICDCCPALWNGGIATTPADLSSVALYDMADVTTHDGGHYVLECVEIIPCIQVGRWLIGWRGVVKGEGDIILYDTFRAYRFTRL